MKLNEVYFFSMRLTVVALCLVGCSSGAKTDDDEGDTSPPGNGSDTDSETGSASGGSDGSGDVDGDGDTDGHGDTDVDGDGDTDVEGDGDTDVDGDGDADGDGDSDVDDDTDTDSGPEPATDSDGDSDTGEMSTSETAAPLCEAWEADLGEETLWIMNAWGLERSVAIFEGRVGAPLDVEQGHRMTVTIDKVWYGWSQLEGLTVAVDMSEGWLDTLGDAASVIVGAIRYAPVDAEDGVPPRYDSIEAIIPSADRDRYPGRIEYHAALHDWIGVARISGTEEIPGIEGERLWFEVQETLSGTPVDRFWHYFSEVEGMPVPQVSDTEYLIVATAEPSVDADYMRIFDFRLATEETLTRVEAGLANPSVPFGFDREADFGVRYRAGWDFFLAEHVVAAEVSGLANECCTNSGGMYFAYDVTDRYRNAENVSGFARFFWGAYPAYPCGERSIVGFHELSQVTSEEIDESFTCDLGSGNSPVNPPVEMSDATVDLAATAENEAYVQTALKSAGPLYRLYNLDETVDPSSFPGDGEIKLWSLPLDLMDGLSVSPVIRIRIDEVVPHDLWTEIRIATLFSETFVDKVEPFHLKLGIPCGDDRLLEVGSEWYAGVIAPRGAADTEEKRVREGEAFLVPGVLIPAFNELVRRF